ncbi:sulfite exporter TauE/SafE family protein [Leptospira sp. 201903071]|uniref:sulfite exporter TauE/SafE family protein n=1 Tax=Leptospira ainazelensis TaxID=2810034 RepID=UPI0019644C3E|nr:sulfite exporter TauE/SafE family protein [Leptospira ainazelensis]MBM9499435.1 sulfite exporter TauE/SafE family protein [Leptospira ainazelensis]
MQNELFLTTLTIAFVHGITSSLHCLGMCGPFAGTLNLANQEQKYKTNLFYNMGRWISYSTLGAIFGTLGSGLNIAGKLVALNELAAIISGIFIVGFGLSLIQNGTPERSGFYQKILNRFAGPLLASLKQGKNLPTTSMAFGMVTGLLPCAVLYPAFSLALATGSAGAGWLVMSIFFLGTFPALFLFGVGFRSLLVKLPQGVIRYGGIIIVFVGISMIFLRLGHSHSEHEHSPNSHPMEEHSSPQEDHSHHH